MQRAASALKRMPESVSNLGKGGGVPRTISRYPKVTSQTLPRPGEKKKEKVILMSSAGEREGGIAWVKAEPCQHEGRDNLGIKGGSGLLRTDFSVEEGKSSGRVMRGGKWSRIYLGGRKIIKTGSLHT